MLRKCALRPWMFMPRARSPQNDQVLPTGIRGRGASGLQLRSSPSSRLRFPDRRAAAEHGLAGISLRDTIPGASPIPPRANGLKSY